LKLSIIVPCFNEEETIKPVLNNLLNVNFPIEKEIIVVDDGSSINHKKIIQEEINSNKIKFIRLTTNQGKGVAIRVGMKHASGDIFIIQDADFEYYPQDIPKLLTPLLNQKVSVVYGTRFKTKPALMSRSHYIANKFLTKLTNFFYNAELTDMETGYKLFTKNTLKDIRLNCREFEFEPEITAKLLLSGYRIKEIPIKYKYRQYGLAKINLFDGIESLLILLQCRFCPHSKLYHLLYNVYKFHMKKVLNKLLTFFKKIFH
jgi:glycosyltransferase involved in cell wall biosynthesis